MKLSELIKSEREKLGLSQRELAKQINVDNALISRIESGSIAQPNYLILLKLSMVFKMDVSDLLFLANYDIADIMLLQKIGQFQIMGGISPEKRKKYVANGEVDFKKVIADYKLSKLDEYEAIGLFIDELGLGQNIGIYTLPTLSTVQIVQKKNDNG